MNKIVDFNQISNTQYEQMDTRFEEEFGVMRAIMKAKPRPSYNINCLNELLEHQSQIHSAQGQIVHQGKKEQVNYYVLSSATEGVFCLGGDLALFKEYINARDRQGLVDYGRLCIDNLWLFYGTQSPITTISLVEGQAMGGGFESALSAHVLMAEKSALLGLPEVLFNLFPGMGALSHLSRKIGMPAAEKMVRSGKIYTGEELYQMGVVDVLAEDGQGEYTLKNWIKKTHRSLNSFQAINKAKQRVNPLKLEELYDIVDVWADAALRLDDRNLRIMERLVKAQNSKVSTSGPTQLNNQQTA